VSEEEKVKEYYDTTADEYDEKRKEQYFSIIDELSWEQITGNLILSEHRKILDAGGGTGEWSIPLAEEGFEVTMIDISEKMIQMAQKKAEEAGVSDRMNCVTGNLKNLQFDDGWFDAVVCEGEVLSCIEPEAVDSVIGEIARVLRRGGKLIVSAGNRYFLSLFFLKDSIAHARAMLTASSVKAPADITSSLFSRQELEKTLQNHGIAVESTVGVGVLTLFYKEYLQKKSLQEEERAHLKELERALSQSDGVKEIAPSIRVIGIKQ
jgi:S-adenosylmethionine-dependent methyltransferase